MIQDTSSESSLDNAPLAYSLPRQQVNFIYEYIYIKVIDMDRKQKSTIVHENEG